MSTSDEDTSVLKLAEPAGTASKGNAAPGTPSIEDQISASEQLSDLQKRIKELEKSNASLETAIKRGEPQLTKSKGAGAGKTRHVAHAEGWRAICTAPDYCKVGKDIIAFNSFATLDTKVTASPNVQARGTAIYRKGDVIKNVQSDAGKHIVSGTSLGSGHVKILDGHESVKVNGLPVARHDSSCLINCDAAGGGGTQGKLVTEQKSVGASGGSVAANPEAPPGKRTNAKLEALLSARAKVASGMLDLNAIDEFVNFKESNQLLDRLIGEISGTPGTVSDYAAQAARGALGFAKDFAMGGGELAYEGIKAVPKLVQLTQTQSGQVLAQLDAQILAENIRLGNISPETMGRAALDVGKAVLKPVTDPWAKKQYVEAITRGAAELGTAGIGWLKGRKARQAVKDAALTKNSAAAKTAEVASSAKPAGSVTGDVNDGVHIKKACKPKFSGDWDNYQTQGIRVDPMESAEGRRMVIEFEKQGLSHGDALRETMALLETGSSLPLVNPIEIGDKFYKVVTKGQSIGQSSAFWVTKDELTFLKAKSYDQIADRLGLPLASQQGTTFQVFEITAFRRGTSFTSKIASTNEIGEAGAVWSQRADGIQTLLTDRSIFTSPVLTTMKFP